jgi:ribosomal protein S18 acetylase RimI-like enzyme
MRASPSYSIRLGATTDALFLKALGAAAFGEYAGGSGQGTLRLARRGTTLLACEGDRRLGFAIVETAPHRAAHLSAIATLEGVRGQGIGSALLSAAEKLARLRGAPSIELMTADSNLGALALFIRNGFRFSARPSASYARGQRTVLLEKDL